MTKSICNELRKYPSFLKFCHLLYNILTYDQLYRKLSENQYICVHNFDLQSLTQLIYEIIYYNNKFDWINCFVKKTVSKTIYSNLYDKLGNFCFTDDYFKRLRLN